VCVPVCVCVTPARPLPLFEIRNSKFEFELPLPLFSTGCESGTAGTAIQFQLEISNFE
jgi:hypothetical protein